MDDGRQAFPRPHAGNTGMTLRQYYAGQALAGMQIEPEYKTGPCNQNLAMRAWAIADQMLMCEGKETYK